MRGVAESFDAVVKLSHRPVPDCGPFVFAFGGLVDENRPRAESFPAQGAKMQISERKCVACGNRVPVCPTAAIEPDELSWPRVVRRAFSDPLVSYESTGGHGRATEEVKTNDITRRVKEGEAGFSPAEAIEAATGKSA